MFVVKWHTFAKGRLDRSTGFVIRDPLLKAPTRYLEWVPFNLEGTEWVEAINFNSGPSAASTPGVYEWVETGPALNEGPWYLGFPRVARMQESWVIASERQKPPGGWASGLMVFNTSDPFGHSLDPVWSEEPPVQSPASLYRCADGILRLFTGDPGPLPTGARSPAWPQHQSSQATPSGSTVC